MKLASQMLGHADVGTTVNTYTGSASLFPGTGAVTRAENVRRARAATAKDYCYRGHEFTPENTWIDPDGWRRCRECRAIRQRAWRARQKDAA